MLDVTSLAVQRLGLCLPMQGGPGLIPDWGAEIPHTSRPKTKTQNRSNVVTNPIKTLKMVHIRKIKTCGLKKKKKALIFSCYT